MFRDESCFSLDRTFIVCDQGERVVDGIWEAGGYSLRWGTGRGRYMGGRRIFVEMGFSYEE